MRAGLFSCCGEFADHAREESYRAEHLPELLHQTVTCFRWTVLINLLFLVSDWRYYGQPHFYEAITARSVIMSAAIAGLAAIRFAHSFDHLQVVCAAWSLFVIPSSAVLVSPHTDVALLVTFILPPLFYLVIPVSFGVSLILGLGCSTATLSAYMSTASLSRANFGLILGMLMSNVILVLVQTRSNRLRRVEWSAIQSERAANEELCERRDLLQKILAAVPTPLIIASRETGKLIQVNDAACDHLGGGLVHGTFKLADYIDPHDWEKLCQKLKAEGHTEGFETRLRMPGCSPLDVLLAATTLAIAGAEALLIVVVDITHRKEIEAAMLRLANTDSLSGLPNRARFFHVASAEIKRAERYGRPLAVFMIDIDFFKHINDTHGHEVGDSALKAFANLCRSWVRQQDVVARLGGEEFGLLLPETDSTNAMVLAERLCEAAAGLHIDRLPAPLTISIGVSEILPGEVTIDAALSRADQALYTAKRSGRNRAVHFDLESSVPASRH